MPYKYLMLEKKEGIAYITINRPEVLNALNAEVMDELRRALLDLRHDRNVWAVIITGAGERAFISGADINELARLSPVEGKETSRRGQHVFELIENLGKPVIAAINGWALGGGCELAMACTLRVASENAKIGLPEVKLGIIPGYGGTQRLPRLVGRGRALELILTGRAIDAAQAERIGLVNYVVPQQELMAKAEALAREIMANGPIAVRYAIEAVNRGWDISEGEYIETTLFGLTCATEDMREGTRAFLEKRKAEFKNR